MYKRQDGTTTAKSASWTIGKATGSITLSASSLSLTYPKISGTITVTRPQKRNLVEERYQYLYGNLGFKDLEEVEALAQKRAAVKE